MKEWICEKCHTRVERDTMPTCRACGSGDVVPVQSPKGQRLVAAGHPLAGLGPMQPLRGEPGAAPPPRPPTWGSFTGGVQIGGLKLPNWLGGVGAIVVIIVLVVAATKKDEPRPAPVTVRAQPPPVPPAPPALDAGQPDANPFTGPLFADPSTRTLDETLAIFRPLADDTPKIDDPGMATTAVARWASDHLKWSDVSVAKNETTFALFRKDPYAEFGKRVCVGGTVLQIHAIPGSDPTVFSGLLGLGDPGDGSDIIRFNAVGSTGKLVDYSHGRFCGLLTGLYNYRNPYGERRQAISLVGMFDLPENHPPARAPAGKKK